MDLHWKNYQEILDWNDSFGLPPEYKQERLEEDQINYIFFQMQCGLCDREIAQMSNTHECIVDGMRSGRLYSEIGQQYDYPIVFTRELLTGRIQSMIVEEAADVVDICKRTGATPNFVAVLYQKFLPDEFKCQNPYGYH